MLRQRPLGGKPPPGGQGAAEDVPPDAAVEIFVQGQPAPGFQGICQHRYLSKLTL